MGPGRRRRWCDEHKSETRNPNFETNPNVQKRTKFETFRSSVFGFRGWGEGALFRTLPFSNFGFVSDFDIRNSYLRRDGNPLEGANRYVLQFDKGQTPPANVTWSVSMYDPQGYYAPNAINRFHLAAWMLLKYNPDASIELYIQASSPGGENESNLLSVPASGPFNSRRATSGRRNRCSTAPTRFRRSGRCDECELEAKLFSLAGTQAKSPLAPPFGKGGLGGFSRRPRPCRTLSDRTGVSRSFSQRRGPNMFGLSSTRRRVI